MKYKVTVYCDGIMGRDVHCNKYLAVQVNDTDDIDDKIEESGWTVLEDNILCDNEKCRVPSYKKSD